jgi:hypothetical protein
MVGSPDLLRCHPGVLGLGKLRNRWFDQGLQIFISKPNQFVMGTGVEGNLYVSQQAFFIPRGICAGLDARLVPC